MNFLITGMTISAALLLGACSSSSNTSSSSNDSETPEIGNIAGLWNGTSIDPEQGEDIEYFEIFADGRMTTYDYDFDEVDAGENCYTIDYDQTLTPLGENQYLSEFAGFPEETQTYTISRTASVLTVSYIDTFDENGNNDSTDRLTFTYPLLTGVDPVFNECE